MVNEWTVQRELERLYNLPEKNQQPGWWTKLRQALSLWARQNNEPQIYEEYDLETGRPYWRVYNPTCDRWLELDSQEAVLNWLERYPYYG